RVHHGVDAEYLDRNYGGVLLLWDRLFGTLQPERQRPTYGTTVPLRSYNPLWGNAQHLHRCWRLCRAAPRLRDRIWVWFAHPASLREGVTEAGSKRARASYRKYRAEVPRSTAWYARVNRLLVVTLVGPFVFVGHSLPIGQIAAAAGVLA